MTIDASARAYQRYAASVTDREVSPPAARAKTGWRLRGRSPDPGPGSDRQARQEAEEVLAAYESCIGALNSGLARLGKLARPRLLGKVEDDRRRVAKAEARLEEARRAVASGDFGLCGKALEDTHRELSSVGGSLMAALSQELSEAAITRDGRAALEASGEERRSAQAAVDRAQQRSPREAMLASATAFRSMAHAVGLAADILVRQAPPPLRAPKPAAGDAGARLVAPRDLETFADVGGLEGTLDQIEAALAAMLEISPATTTGARARHNGILLHGPPGTGKTLLARAAAGEHGLRFLRVSAAVVTYDQEPAKRLRQLFALAAESTPCLLFLDEVDAMAGRRQGAASVDHHHLTTQLLDALDEYRGHPGLVVMAATNDLDHLDPALREGRFDLRIAVPLPDAAARTEIRSVQLEAQGVPVDWDDLDLDEIAGRSSGRSGAFLASVVSGAALRARGRELVQSDLAAEIESRSGQDRAQTLEEEVRWDDVVLPTATRKRLQEILLLFQQPELGRQLGVRPPAGILLHGPPGTGKTTIARALATEVKASFYEQSAADLLSKWAGESEQRVAQLFARARSNRPAIIFCDEVDALLRRRNADSSTPWDERVVSQFLRELDGLHSGEGVLVVGSTNRPDIIDEAVRERRLVPIEVPLPDAAGRRALLEVLWRQVTVAPDVDLDEVAHATDGMSGADLRAIRDSAGMKALARVASARETSTDRVAVEGQDVAASLAERGLTMDKKTSPKGRSMPDTAERTNTGSGGDRRP